MEHPSREKVKITKEQGDLNTMSWHDPDKEDITIYKVVVNHEEQYSIWPEYKENPLGWNPVGKEGLKAECLAYIKEVWTDMGHGNDSGPNSPLL
jgi:MbtH protein